MFRVLYSRDLLLLRHHITTKTQSIIIHFNHLDALQNQNPLPKFISNVPESTNKPSFTVDYLVNKCGLPPKTALFAAKNFRLCSTVKADSAISLFESYGLTKTHITKLISLYPNILSYDSNKNLKPKFEFLKESGIPGPDISNLIASDPILLTRSLQNHIIPSFNFLKNHVGTTTNILILLKRDPRFFEYSIEKQLIPNISILQAHGVPDSNISKLLVSQPRTFAHKSDSFKETVEKVKKMGFDPLSTMFLHAVRTVSSLSNSNWERKLMIYREFGWSDNNILYAFKKQPLIMLLSEEKIRRGMKFFSEKLKCMPIDISVRPSLLQFSLEKRIIPRCAVAQVLYLKGIIKKKLNVVTVFCMSERMFLEKFVIKHQDTVPEVMKAFNGEIEFTGSDEVFYGITPVITSV